jgi:uncharacterized protein YndB with AHSA1/START domain
MRIAIETTVEAPIQRVWAAWITPEDIQRWNFATDEWICPRADIELSVGGKFSYRMEARDGSIGFDFEGVFTRIENNRLIEFELGDQRRVSVEFSEAENGVRLVERFEVEDQHSAEQQREGWQSILDNFKKHVEATAA